MDSSTNKRGKEIDRLPATMKYHYQGQVHVSKLEDQIRWVTDTEIGHIEIEYIKAQFNKPSREALHQRIKRSSLVETTVFAQSLQAPELIMAIAPFYNPKTRKCTDAEGKTIIDLSFDMLGFIFGIPTREEVFLLIEEEALKAWNDKISASKRHMNANWLEEERKTRLKAIEILRANFKEPQKDLIIMLSRASSTLR